MEWQPHPAHVVRIESGLAFGRNMPIFINVCAGVLALRRSTHVMRCPRRENTMNTLASAQSFFPCSTADGLAVCKVCASIVREEKLAVNDSLVSRLIVHYYVQRMLDHNEARRTETRRNGQSGRHRPPMRTGRRQ